MPDQHQLFTASNQFYDHLSRNEFDTLGKQQWQALRDIEAQFDTMPMTEFNNVRFSTNTWPLTNSNTTMKNIHWHKALLSDGSNFPWVLLLKLSIYYRIEQLKLSTTSYSATVSFCQRWTPYLQRENILVSKEDTPFLPANIITKETLHDWFVDSIKHSPFKDNSQIDYWSHLIANSAHALPKTANVLKADFELPWSGIKKRNGLYPSSLYLNQLLGSMATRTEVLSFVPFSSITLSKLLDNAIPVFTDHASALIDIFKTFKQHYPQNSTKAELYNDDSFSPNDYFRAMNSVIKKHNAALDCFPKLKQTVGNNFIRTKKGNYNLGLSWLYDLHQQCIAATTWIVLLTTALRNVDMRKSLMRDCIVPDPDGGLLNYLVTDIQKVSLIDYPIPIPKLTVDAIGFLNDINFAPDNNKSDYVPNLITRLFLHRKSENWHLDSGNQLNIILRAFAEGNGIDLLDGLEDNDNEEGVAHRCRATMAEWIGTNSPLAVLIVKRLFAHVNEIMPDHYLRNNKKVIEERKRIQNETYEDLSEGASEAIVDNKFSGGWKDKIKSDVAEIKAKLVEDNKSLIGDELRQTLKDHIKKLLIERLKNGDSLGLQTPLGFICMRNPSSTEPAPCSGKRQKIKMENANIDKRFMRALQVSTLPNLDNCQGASCKHSLLYENSMTELLLKTFHYYVNYLKGVGQFNVEHMDDEAENFINLYYPPLKDVYPEIEKELNNLELS
tara:strand:- start:21905 stop:24076 length:2172 start_codon:yes stop_codon:yes gene_type:complete